MYDFRRDFNKIITNNLEILEIGESTDGWGDVFEFGEREVQK